MILIDYFLFSVFYLFKNKKSSLGNNTEVNFLFSIIVLMYLLAGSLIIKELFQLPMFYLVGILILHWFVFDKMLIKFVEYRLKINKPKFNFLDGKILNNYLTLILTYVLSIILVIVIGIFSASLDVE